MLSSVTTNIANNRPRSTCACGRAPTTLNEHWHWHHCNTAALPAAAHGRLQDHLYAQAMLDHAVLPRRTAANTKNQTLGTAHCRWPEQSRSGMGGGTVPPQRPSLSQTAHCPFKITHRRCPDALCLHCKPSQRSSNRPAAAVRVEALRHGKKRPPNGGMTVTVRRQRAAPAAGPGSNTFTKGCAKVPHRALHSQGAHRSRFTASADGVGEPTMAQGEVHPLLLHGARYHLAGRWISSSGMVPEQHDKGAAHWAPAAPAPTAPPWSLLRSVSVHH